jgi:hypothetical protein
VSRPGFLTPGGPGNGTPPRRNPVKLSALWWECRDKIEKDFPRFDTERVFDGIEAYMVVCEVEEDARYIGGVTWFIQTPDDYSPIVMVYFTYEDGKITCQAAYAYEW